MSEIRALTATEAAQLLRRWQANEWALDRRATKKAHKEQRQIVAELLGYILRRKAEKAELDYVMSCLN